VKLNVALTFNVKPESETFQEIVSPNSNNTKELRKKSVDTFAEWDTWDTINAVKGAIECFHTVNMVEADQNAYNRFMETRPDIVFNISEGFNGVSREAQIPAILDMLDIPYTGSDPLTLATCLDKARTKEILSYYNIPNSRFVIAESPTDVSNLDLKFPLMVKPVSEGSGKGIFSTSFVENKKDLVREVERITFEYTQPALVEEFLPGREFTAAVLGNGAEAEVLPIVEINYKDFPDDFVPIYSYEAKWILDTTDNPLDVFDCPAKISAQLEKAIKNNVLRTFHTLRCRDWSRIDIRLDDRGIPNIIEVNPLPGILPNPEENSCYPKAARTAGINYNDMINKVLFAAAKRHNLV
jgi:D-alanine-D-alanine ligase